MIVDLYLTTRERINCFRYSRKQTILTELQWCRWWGLRENTPVATRQSSHHVPLIFHQQREESFQPLPSPSPPVHPQFLIINKSNVRSNHLLIRRGIILIHMNLWHRITRNKIWLNELTAASGREWRHFAWRENPVAASNKTNRYKRRRRRLIRQRQK